MRSRTPAVVLALVAPLLLSSPSVGSDPVDPPASALPGGAVCEAKPEVLPQRSLEEEVARLAASGQLPADKDVVMLNGRGYNYGPTPEQQLDMIQVEALKAEAELVRKKR